LYHKTTNRTAYDQARARHPGCDEVLMWNRRGELTETTRANLVLNLPGGLFTPAASCGLLAGTYRAALLERGRVREAVLPVDAFHQATGVFLVNSVRGWIRVRRAHAVVPAGESEQPRR
jgi:para-aminobenzoate synthetase/4-amino-4-deoxychorismate lyase